MKTDDLIRALAADAAPAALPLASRLALLLGGAVIAAGLAFWLLLGPREDALQSLGQPRFLFKFIVTLLLAASAFGLARRQIRPGAAPGIWATGLLLAPVLLLVAVALELLALPATQWRAALVGENARICLTYVPLIGLLPLGLLLFALRAGAPMHPARAGAVAGLIAGGLAAAFYAAHCPDDSPLFVAVWYSLGIALLAALGALLGGRLLRW